MSWTLALVSAVSREKPLKWMPCQGMGYPCLRTGRFEATIYGDLTDRLVVPASTGCVGVSENGDVSTSILVRSIICK